MNLREQLSRLHAGDLSPGEAAALWQRIRDDVDVAQAWRLVCAVSEGLSALRIEEPPAHLLRAVRGRRGPWMAWPGALGGAFALAASLALMMWPGSPQLHLVEGMEVVRGRGTLMAADASITFDGEVRVEVEPGGRLVRVGGAKEGQPMDWSHAASALAGAAVTVTVWQGSASVYRDHEPAITLEAGEQRTFGLGPTAVRHADGDLPAPPIVVPGEAPALTIARLQAQVADLGRRLKDAETMGAVARGQLQVEQGTPIPWPDDLAATFQPVGFQEAIREAVAANPGLTLESVDCAEYPCVALLRVLDPSWEMQAALKPITARWEDDDAANLSVMASKMNDGETSVGLAAISLGRASDFEGNDTIDHRLEWRAGTMMKDLGEELMGAARGER